MLLLADEVFEALLPDGVLAELLPQDGHAAIKNRAVAIKRRCFILYTLRVDIKYDTNHTRGREIADERPGEIDEYDRKSGKILYLQFIGE